MFLYKILRVPLGMLCFKKPHKTDVTHINLYL